MSAGDGMKLLTRTLLAASLLPVAACGTATGENPSPARDDARGGTRPVTARALAAVAAEHAGMPSSATREADAAEEFARDGVGAELRYDAGGESDGDMLVVAVGKGLPRELTGCDAPPEWLAGCAEVDGAVLLWEQAAPEEDPGVVYLVAPKEEGAALIFYAGPTITGDPRDLDLPISVDDLAALATDPRIDLTTSQAAIEAGADLDTWRD